MQVCKRGGRGDYALTFHYPIGGVQDHVSVRHLHGQWMSPGECVSPSSQKKRFILGVFSVGAVASLGCVYSVSHRRIMLERVEEDDTAAVAETETVVRGRMELLMGWGR